MNFMIMASALYVLQIALLARLYLFVQNVQQGMLFNKGIIKM